MYGREIHSQLDHRVIEIFEPGVQLVLVGLDHFDQQHRTIFADRFDASRQRIELHPFDIYFDQFEARKVERIKTDGLNIDHTAFGIIDRLADKLRILPLPELRPIGALADILSARDDVLVAIQRRRRSACVQGIFSKL